MCYNVHMDAQKRRYYIDGPRCSVAEASAITGYSRRTILRMIDSGRLIGWPKAGGKNKELFRRQVEDITVMPIRKAIKRAQLLQASFDFSDFF